MNLFKMLDNMEYLNMAGQTVRGRKGTIVSMPRRSDVKKGLKEGKIEPANGETRAAHTMTTTNTTKGTPEPVVLFEVADLVQFKLKGKDTTGEIKNVNARGVLDIEIGTEGKSNVVRINPEEVKVEKLA